MYKSVDKMRSSPSIVVTLLLRLLFLLLGTETSKCLLVTAKKTSGTFQLSGQNTEVMLGTFSALKESALIELDLIADGVYRRPDHLHLRAYRDTEWPQVKKLTTCKEKIQHALYEKSIQFEKSETHETDGGTYTARTHFQIRMHDPQTEELIERNHYWYFTIDDCSLEDYYQDNAIPNIHYTIHMRNFRIWKTHYVHYGEFSSDDQNIFPIHAFSMLFTCISLGCLLVFVTYQLNFDRSKSYTIHIAVLWVMGAALLDILSGTCELLHIAQYNQDGVGNYTLDALSAHFEAQCDSMIMILLLSIAAGWTLPTSVITVPGNSSSTSENVHHHPVFIMVQKLISSLAHPISTGISGPSGILAVVVATTHVILAQWGRVFNDEFDSYHDFDHAPGYFMLFFRTVAGFLFMSAVQSSTSKPNCPPNIQQFYRMYGLIGLLWFWLLPLWVIFCHVALPYYKLKPYVYGGCCVLQGLSHIMLGLLVAMQSMSSKNSGQSLVDNTYVNVSDISSTEPIPVKAPVTWSIGRRAKIRLD
jgi:Rhodopsin-like GPCR transmembrane domain